MKKHDLTSNWKLSEQPLFRTAGEAELVRQSGSWMEVAKLPCDIHMPLIENGTIKEPTQAGNCFDCEWTEKRSWWFKKTFELKEEDISKFGMELFIESLDLNADLFLNGTHIGHSENAFLPFVKNVRPWLIAGENELLIRLTCGLETVSDEMADPIRDFVACEWRTRRKGRGEDRRTYLRKPQHVFGWDQSLRIATCAICGEVSLTALDEVAVRDIRFETLALNEDWAEVLAEADVESREIIFARDMVVTLSVEKDGKTVYEETRDIVGQAGHNYLKYRFMIPNPELWWPAGYGAQELYTVRVKAVNLFGAEHEKEIRTGIRTVELDTSRLGGEERRYAFLINGKRIYCKGMDFIHSDALHARSTDEKLEGILRSVHAAGFNMIRFWDGNRYESDRVFELLDELGILAIQTFCFACGAYPDHIDSFRRTVELEAEYQLKRLRSHPCMALWCGNGECNGLLHSYFGKNYFDQHDPAIHAGGMDIAGEILPKVHARMVETVPYQCCSPFGGIAAQEVPERGDIHYYPFLNVAPSNQQYRISTQSFDAFRGKFVTESGVMGPPSYEAMLEALGGEELSYDDPVFLNHRNTFEKDAVRDAVYRHYTGEKELNLKEYCLYGGLFQGMMLAYAADCMRLSYECSGSLLWCINDCYGEVGFSMLEYGGNPKPAYYFLKRAYSSYRVILRKDGDSVKVYCSNDTSEEKEIRLHCGYVSFAGQYGPVTELTAVLPAYSGETLIGEVSCAGADLVKGIMAAWSEDPAIVPATLKTADFRELEVGAPVNLKADEFRREGDALSFTVSCDSFAHAVHFGLPSGRRFDDLYFDLLPGQKKRVTLYNAQGLTEKDIVPQSICVRG